MDSCPTLDERAALSAFGLSNEALIRLMCRLWAEVFADDVDFIMHYLRTFSRRDNRILLFSAIDGSLVAMMHFHTFTAHFSTGTDLTGSYIYGVATAPRWRSRGIASAMLCESFKKMELNGIDFAMLIAEEPSLREWYKNFGFELLDGITVKLTGGDASPAKHNLAEPIYHGMDFGTGNEYLNVPMVRKTTRSGNLSCIDSEFKLRFPQAITIPAP